MESTGIFVMTFPSCSRRVKTPEASGSDLAWGWKSQFSHCCAGGTVTQQLCQGQGTRVGVAGGAEPREELAEDRQKPQQEKLFLPEGLQGWTQ